ncbi:hypothetical protein MTO96_042206 [Rhipicephalus appendiculatus]
MCQGVPSSSSSVRAVAALRSHREVCRTHRGNASPRRSAANACFWFLQNIPRHPHPFTKLKKDDLAQHKNDSRGCVHIVHGEMMLS